MTLETPTIIRKRGGQSGNSNALKHGFRSAFNPYPREAPQRSDRGALALVSAQPSASKDLDSKDLFRRNLRVLDQIDHVIFTLVPRMFAAPSQEKMLEWFRPFLQLIRAKQRVMRAMFLVSYHDRVLFTLARDSIQLAYQEFADRGLREFPITLPSDFEDFCAHPSSTSYAFGDNAIVPPSDRRVFVWIYFKKLTRYHLSSGKAASRARRLQVAFGYVRDTSP
jgi:hypothetical protein